MHWLFSSGWNWLILPDSEWSFPPDANTREQIVSYMLENGFKLGDSPYSLADEYNGLVEKAIASGSSIWRERYGLHVD